MQRGAAAGLAGDRPPLAEPVNRFQGRELHGQALPRTEGFCIAEVQSTGFFLRSSEGRSQLKERVMSFRQSNCCTEPQTCWREQLWQSQLKALDLCQVNTVKHLTRCHPGQQTPQTLPNSPPKAASKLPSSAAGGSTQPPRLISVQPLG